MAKPKTVNKPLGLDDRKKFQDAESYPEVKDDLPKGRFQDDKQTNPIADTQSRAAAVTGDTPASVKDVVPTIARDIKKSMSISPNSDVEILDGQQIGGVPLANPVQTRSVAGADKIPLASDISRSPYTNGGNRPNSRFGKKNTVPNFIIDNTVCEQLKPHFDEVPNLKDDPESAVGYNGNKMYDVARGKKNAGAYPQNMLFDRSIDFEHNSFVVHTTGQVLSNIAGSASYPTKSTSVVSNLDITHTQDEHGYYDITHPMQKSNYLLRSFTFDLVNGKISNPHFVEERIDSHACNATQEQANMNWQIDSNNVTHSVIKLQTELGRETTDKWSPLGYVIEQPYEYNMLAHDMEATTGAMMALAYRSASFSMSYQLNMLAKDGAKPVSPGYRAFLDGIAHEANSDYYDGLGSYYEDLLDPTKLVSGSAAALIAAYDSKPKYTHKSDLYNMPRSLKLWLQSVDNNLNPLHLKKEFIKAVNDVSMFSTVDGTYNPMLPIHVTDQIHIINPLSLNYFLQGWVRPAVFGGVNTGTQSIYQYSYNDLRQNTYLWDFKHPLVEGLLRWMLNNEGALTKAYGSNVTGITWPCSFDMTTFNMFAYVLCAAAFDVSFERNVILRDILFAGEQASYIWSDLSSLSDVNPLSPTQFGYVDYGTALKLGKLTTSSVIRETWPETYVPRINTKGVNSVDYQLPWYLTEYSFQQAYVDDINEYHSPTRPGGFNYPSRRSGVNSAIFDTIYSMKPEELLFSMDRIVRPLYPMTKSTSLGYDGRALCSQYSAATYDSLTLAAERYDSVSDGRLVQYASDSHHPTMASVYECPRQFGYIFPDMGFCPINVGGVRKAKAVALDDWLDVRGARYIESFSALGSLNITGVYTHQIDRSAALQQKWYRCFMCRYPDVVAINLDFEDKTGMLFGMSSLITANADATAASIDVADVVVPNLFTIGGTAAPDAFSGTSVVTFSKMLWPMLQRNFFAVDPYDGVFDASSDGTTKPLASAPVDNMEQSVYFGWCGFKAADFNQLIIQRLNNISVLNISYTVDDFLSKSVIFRE